MSCLPNISDSSNLVRLPWIKSVNKKMPHILIMTEANLNLSSSITHRTYWIIQPHSSIPFNLK